MRREQWHNEHFAAWVRFLRLPNLLTVPGDVFAGSVLGGGIPGEAFRVLPAVCLAYLFGMALNDLWDQQKDTLERPERPLPSGKLSRPQALTACALLGFGALAVYPAPVMMALLGAILAYTTLKGPFPLAGFLLMGACRGFSVWIGAGAPLSVSAPLAGGIGLWCVYIAAVTWLASAETGKKMNPQAPWILPILLNVGLVILAYTAPNPSPWAYFPGLASFAMVNVAARDMIGAQKVNPAAIGRLLRLLFVMQAFVLALYGHPLSATGIWALLPLMKWTQKQVPAS